MSLESLWMPPQWLTQKREMELDENARTLCSVLIRKIPANKGYRVLDNQTGLLESVLYGRGLNKVKSGQIPLFPGCAFAREVFRETNPITISLVNEAPLFATFIYPQINEPIPEPFILLNSNNYFAAKTKGDISMVERYVWEKYADELYYSIVNAEKWCESNPILADDDYLR